MSATTENLAERKPRTFTLNHKAVNLDDVIPLTIGDLKQLKKKGVDLVKMNDDSIELEHLATVVLYVCQKSNPDITDEDVDTMPTSWLNRIGAEAMKPGEDDLPF